MSAKFLHLTITVSIALWLNSAFCADSASALTRAEMAVRNGDFYFHKQLFRKALPFYDEALRLNPNDFHSHIARAKVLLNLEEKERALSDVELAIKLDPTSAAAYITRARCKYELSDCAAAVADITQGINLDKDVVDKAFQMRERSVYNEAQGKFSQALDDLNVSISTHPDSHTHLMRGKLEYRLKLYQNAVDDITEGIRTRRPNIDNGLDLYYEERARAYDKLGQTALAERDRKKSSQYLKINPYLDFMAPISEQKAQSPKPTMKVP